MRTPVIAGNWKMNLDAQAADALVQGLREAVGGASVEVGVAPPFPYLAKAVANLEGSTIFVAAQNMHWETGGAFTGEVAASMLVDLGVTHVILGHSERRHVMGETLDQVACKVRLALASSLRPILCVGETLAERQAERTNEVLIEQMATALDGLSGADLDHLVVAYEPVWAIGTGVNASPAQAGEVHAFLREWVAGRFDTFFADALRIQYGGSVKPSNAAELMAVEGVDGALVGGASLTLENFLPIVRSPEPATP